MRWLCSVVRPSGRSTIPVSAGLIWAINGGRLVEVRRDWAVIDVPVHRSQRVFYRRNVHAAKITLSWAKQPSFEVARARQVP
jgi:hypothetical protein